MSLKGVGAFPGLLTIQKINFALLKREKNSLVQCTQDVHNALLFC